ncbi:MAG: hypothetical protein IKG87_13760 [Clostridia bacterium]|nr:hypothetical protein [Clostridia bacterium]
MDFEKCCICGKTTAIRYDTPICQRTGYMEGAGQLCMDCYRDILFPGKKVEQEEDLMQAELICGQVK